jgi:aminoglycoside phosphotransferase (APT) family kinase protein
VADVAIDESLVRALLREQHRDLADLALIEVDAGWDNRLFRLGRDLLVRLPRRELSAPLVDHEHRWLPELAARLPLPIPVPIRVGLPGCGFPWRWSVVPWLVGDTLLLAPPDDPAVTARELDAFLRALHQPAAPDAPRNPWRGVPLSARAATTQSNLERLGSAVDHAAALCVWRRALAAAPWALSPVWIHGDLHPRNLLAVDGRLSAVIDFGDLTAGDPATDLAIAWMLPQPFGEALREAARDRFDEATWRRARGWALALGLAYVAGSPDGDPMIALGRVTIAAALTDAV